MANKVRTISLDRQEIKKTIQDLQNMKKTIKGVPSDIESILDEAVLYCQSLTPISDGQGRHLVYNTYWTKTPSGYRIVQEGENVLYVEFGTGQVGSETPHELANKLGWVYGIGEHIFTTKDGKVGWFFPTDSTRTEYRFTQGQRANMQMYKTAQWLSKKLNVEVKLFVEKVKQQW